MKSLHRIALALVFVALAVVIAYSQSAAEGSVQTPLSQSPDEQRDDGTMVTNHVLHSVPLEAVIFDDFDIASRSRPLTAATQADIERLRDRITPLCGESVTSIEGCLPASYETAKAASSWLRPSMAVIGIAADDGQAYAFPFGILNFHEIVNDTLADEPILISYCPLCNSAVVYSRVVNGEEVAFGNTSALYQSDMIMYDTATDSFWFQVEGRAIVGDLTNTRLELLPSVVTTWQQWQADYPFTLVLARPKNSDQYARDVFGRYAEVLNQGQTFFPVDERYINDGRLDPATTVLLVEINYEAVAYPLAALGDAVTSDTIGETDIVVLSQQEGPSGAAYEPITEDGVAVDLALSDDGAWIDSKTGSSFDLSGRAIDGDLVGQQLVPVAARYTFWFAAVATAPQVEVYES